MVFSTVSIMVPEGANIILGHSHFIKTVEDVYEAIVNTHSSISFGVAFSEASGPCLVRSEGNDPALQQCAEENVKELGCGHCFIVVMKGGFPINVLGRIKDVPEVVGI